MSEIRPCTIIIESVVGETPGLAAQIWYLCTIVREDGSRLHDVKVIPEGDRWDPPTMIHAAKPRGTVRPDGTIASGIWPGRERGPDNAPIIAAYITELPATKPCGDNP